VHTSEPDQYLLVDWGDTVMRELPGQPGPMETWPRVEAVAGAREALLELQPSFGIALATNAAESDEAEIRRALERCALSALFARVFSARDLGEHKPEPAFFRAILADLELAPSSVFMIGDSLETDALGANGVGIPAVWLNRRTHEVRSGPLLRTVHSWSEVAEALASLGAHI
jgi:HAD superfamily hydrolase (TIGR01509 family)